MSFSFIFFIVLLFMLGVRGCSMCIMILLHLFHFWFLGVKAWHVYWCVASFGLFVKVPCLFQEEFCYPVECLTLTVEEVMHIRQVLVKAELEKFQPYKDVYNALKKGKVGCLKGQYTQNRLSKPVLYWHYNFVFSSLSCAFHVGRRNSPFSHGPTLASFVKGGWSVSFLTFSKKYRIM